MLEKKFMTGMIKIPKIEIFVIQPKSITPIRINGSYCSTGRIKYSYFAGSNPYNIFETSKGKIGKTQKTCTIGFIIKTIIITK